MKVLIVEDEPAIAQDIEITLEDAGYEVVGIAGSSSKALDLLHSRKPDIALLDISIKGDRNGIELAHLINENYKIPFVFLTSFSDRDTIEKVKETFPYGYIVKPFKDSDLAPALEVALMRFHAFGKKSLPGREDLNDRFGTNLTKKEYEVITLVWEGKSNNEIAETSFISINTVKSHLSSAFLKLDVKSRSSLLALIREV